MMKKRIVAFFLCISFMTLVSCGSESQTMEGETETTIQEQTEEIAEENASDIMECYLEDNSNISVYQDFAQEKNIIVDGDKEIPFQIDGGLPEIVGAYKMDIDGNQTQEYVVTICEGRGTECHIMGLAIIEAGKEKPVFYLTSKEIEEQMNSRFSYEYNEEYRVISLSVEDDLQEEIFINESDDYESEFESLRFGDVFFIQHKNGEFWIRGYLGFTYKNIAAPQFEPSIQITAPLTFEKDYEYNIGKIGVKVLDYVEQIPESDGHSEIISEFSADITHNGYDDQIILAVPTESTLEEVKSGLYPGLCYLFEGNGDGYSPLYSVKREFSPAHVGNGQLFITTVDDKDYLIETNFWVGQGTFTYSYDVFFEDFDAKYEVESCNIVFENCDIPGDTSDFFENLNKWINDSTYVLYAADIDYEQDLFYSTKDHKISPKEYIQYKANQWKK